MTLEEIQKEIESLNQWENLLAADNGKVGKFLKKELNGMVCDVRHLYARIRASEPDAALQLLALQTEERTLQKVLDKMVDIASRKNDLDKSLSIVSNQQQSEENSEPLRRKPD